MQKETYNNCNAEETYTGTFSKSTQITLTKGTV